MKFDSGGTEIHFETTGSGEPLILLHGISFDSTLNWAAVLPLLAQNFQVTTMDARGHGQSDKPHEPEAYGLEMVEDVRRMLDHLGLETAHVYGYSMGAITALKLAEVYPQRLRSVVIGGMGLLTQDEFDEICASHVANQQKAIESPLPYGEFTAARLQEFGDEIQPLPPELITALNRNDPRALLACVQQLDQMRVDPARISAIEGLRCLAILGAQEAETTLGCAQRLAQTWPACRLVQVPDLDHMEAASTEAFTRHVIAFLQG